jgi:hypothetical protein
MGLADGKISLGFSTHTRNHQKIRRKKNFGVNSEGKWSDTGSRIIMLDSFLTILVFYML